MLSKLILIFMTVVIAVTCYIQYQPTIIDAPASVDIDSFFTVTSSRDGQWLVYDARHHTTLGKDLVILSGTKDIKIIFSPGLIQRVIRINKPLDPFMLKIQSWAPASGRPQVADSLESLALGFKGDEIEDFIKLTRLNNHALIEDQWKGFFQKLGKYCQDNMEDKTLSEHQQLWLRVAEALRWKDVNLSK